MLHRWGYVQIRLQCGIENNAINSPREPTKSASPDKTDAMYFRERKPKQPEDLKNSKNQFFEESEGQLYGAETAD